MIITRKLLDVVLLSLIIWAVYLSFKFIVFDEYAISSNA